MFNRKLEHKIKKLEEKNDSITELLLDTREYLFSRIHTVECEKCGCLLNKETATMVEKFIPAHIEETPAIQINSTTVINGQKYLTPSITAKEYYCKIHKPKTCQKK